jgi:hypothetical protein
VSDRLAATSASNRGNAVNAQSKDGNKPNRGEKTPNKAASRPGRVANAQIETASKPSRAVKARSKAANNPNPGGKAADNEVDEVAEEIAINGTIKVKTIVDGAAIAVVSRFVSAGGNGNRSAMIAQRPICATIQPNRCRRANRSRGRRPLACGTRFLGRRQSKRQRLWTSQSMSPAHHLICEMSRARQAAAFPMRMPTIRCRCLTRPRKGIDLANRKMRPMKTLDRIDREAGHVDVVGDAAADECRTIVNQRVARVEPRGSVTMNRVSRDLSRSLKTNSRMRS